MIDLEQALRVYLVADPEQTTGNLVDQVEAALAGGVTMVQLRAKSLSDREATGLARQLRGLCTSYRAAFLVNDRIDIALAVDADGVHLGVDDLPLEDARRIVPSHVALGYSPETDTQASEAKTRGANYLGVGPVFGTASKSDAGVAIGLEVLRRRVELSSLPTIGIGGVTPANAASVIEAGACGVAVIGAILRSDDPHAAAESLRTAVDGALNRRRG